MRDYYKEYKKRNESTFEFRARVPLTLADSFKSKLLSKNLTYSAWLRNQIDEYIHSC